MAGSRVVGRRTVVGAIHFAGERRRGSRSVILDYGRHRACIEGDEDCTELGFRMKPRATRCRATRGSHAREGVGGSDNA
jgi:hypothetical protein